MKKTLPIVAILLVLLTMLTACAKTTTVYEAICEIGIDSESENNSNKYKLDERFSYFQTFDLGVKGALHLKATTGIVSYYFIPQENADGSVTCTLTGIYVCEVAGAVGNISNDIVAEFVDKLTFTLVLEDNVVTSKDLPQLIVE